MEHRADAKQKVLRPCDAIGVSMAAVLEGFGRERMEVPDHRDVAKASRCLFDIGLELVERVVELLMTLGHQGEQRLEGRARVRRGAGGNAIVERGIAGKIAKI